MSKRHQDDRVRNAQRAAGAATTSAGIAAGAAAQRAGAAVTRAGSTLEHQGRASAPAVGAAVGTAVEAVLEAASAARGAADRLSAVASSTAGGLAGTVTGFVDEPGVRGLAALDVLRGVPVGPPAARRRWPWAVLAALLGAAAGVAIATTARRLQGSDAPGAQEPHELRAVVDLPQDGQAPPGPTPPTAAAGGTAPSVG